jgi:perosamine synthetase
VAKGEEVKSFENEFCNFVGLPKGHAVAVSNGTAALYLALLALDGSGKKIASPGYVCSALRHAVTMSEGENVLIDTEYDSPNIELKTLYNKNPQIAIVPHTYGIPIDLSNLKKIMLIEDCSHAIGAKINRKSVGLQGELGIISLAATKMITSGGSGGMLISKNKQLVEKITDYIEYDMKKDDYKRFNFQMNDLQAAIGREQLRKLPDFLKRREEIFQKYKISGLDLLDISTVDNKTIQPVRFRAVLKTKKQFETIKLLKEHDITSRVLNDEWLISQNPKQFPNSFSMVQNSVSLPIYPSLSDEDVEKIISVLVN